MTSSLYRLGSLGFRELQMKEGVPIACKEAPPFREEIHRQVLRFFREHRERVHEGYLVCQYLCSKGANEGIQAVAKDLFGYFAAQKYMTADALTGLYQESLKIREKAYENARAIEAKATEKLQEAEALQAAARRTAIEAEIRLRDVNHHARAWKTTRDALLDTRIRCSDGKEVSASSHILRQNKWFEAFFTRWPQPPTLDFEFSSRCVTSYLDYLENPGSLALTEEARFMELYAFGDFVRDTEFVQRVKRLRTGLLNEEELEKLLLFYGDLPFIAAKQLTFPKDFFKEISPAAISPEAMRFILLQSVQWMSELELLQFLMRWFKETKVNPVSFLQEIRFHRMTHRELAEAASLTRLPLPQSYPSERVYLREAEPGKVEIRYTFRNLRNALVTDKSLHSPPFPFGSHTLFFRIIDSHPSRKWIGITKRGKEKVEVFYEYLIHGRRGVRAQKIIDESGWGTTFSLEELQAADEVEVFFALQLV